jgi:predicted nucleic acid-binding Zn ribbon protein
MNRQAPRAVSDLLIGAVPQLADRLLEHRIRKAWSSTVDPDVARRARPGALVGGCLEVVVDSSPWLCELTLRAADLQRRIADPFPAVRSLRFTLGASSIAGTDEPRAATARRAVPVTAADIEEVEAAVASIADPTLADQARRLMLTARRAAITGDAR